MPNDSQQRASAWTLPGLHQALLRRVEARGHLEAVLDIGCGSGAWLDCLSRAGARRLAGVDRSIASYSGPAAQLLEVNLDKDTVELAGEAFDLVSAIEVVEHLENPGRLFDIAARHLSPNGRFLLTTPNVLSIGARLRLLLSGRVPFFDDKSDPTHLFPVLPRTVAILAERRGLEIVERWHFPEGGTAALRPAVRAGARILSWLPEPDGGDISCWLMARRKE